MSSNAPPRTQFEQFLSESLENAETRAAFEDAQSRNRLVDALVRMRRRFGGTQTQVASKMGVKQPSVSGFETEGSDPRLSTILRYARAVDAVFLWDVRPRLESARTDFYFEREVCVHLGVNQSQPSERAREWHPPAAYTERRLRSVAC